MTSHIKTGKKGEILAANWLSKQGYIVIYRNWRIGKLEIDLIALQNEFIHFIEVKTRTSTHCGGPELSVNYKKFIRFQRASQSFLALHKNYKWVQYDVVAITLVPGQEPIIELFSDVYF